jgi:hypothetical protein
VPVEQRGQGPQILRAEPLPEAVSLERPLEQERVDEHQTVLHQLQRQGHDLLLLPAIGGQLALPAIANKVVGRVPVLDHIEAVVDLALGLP